MCYIVFNSFVHRQQGFGHDLMCYSVCSAKREPVFKEARIDHDMHQFLLSATNQNITLR